jgi:hypothetical protein
MHAMAEIIVHHSSASNSQCERRFKGVHVSDRDLKIIVHRGLLCYVSKLHCLVQCSQSGYECSRYSDFSRSPNVHMILAGIFSDFRASSSFSRPTLNKK